MVFNEMLTIVLVRENKQYEQTYQKFKEKQKKAKAQKKAEANDED